MKRVRDYACHHIGIGTNRPKELIEFYVEKMGFEVTETKSIPENLMKEVFGIPSPCLLTKLKFGLVILEVVSPQEFNLRSRPNDVSGYSHWSLGVEDIANYCRELNNRGVEIKSIERQDKSIYFLKDPDGNLVEIYEV